jgi:hypothetical protein
MPASHKTNVITAARKWRLGIPGVSVVFFIDDAMAQRSPTTAVQKRRALLSLSVEDIWQADERGFTILRPVKKRSRGLKPRSLLGLLRPDGSRALIQSIRAVTPEEFAHLQICLRNSVAGSPGRRTRDA